MSGEMRDVSHAHSETGETFGAGRGYHRGPAATDGGQPSDAAGEGTGSVDAVDGETDTMADVDHTPPHGGAGDRHFWARGFEEVPDEDVTAADGRSDAAGVEPVDGDTTARTGEDTGDDNE